MENDATVVSAGTMEAIQKAAWDLDRYGNDSQRDLETEDISASLSLLTSKDPKAAASLLKAFQAKFGRHPKLEAIVIAEFERQDVFEDVREQACDAGSAINDDEPDLEMEESILK